MAISDKVKLYNIYEEAGCEEGGTFDEWAALIKSWLEENFGDFIDVEIEDTTAGSQQIMYVHMYCKNTSVGTFFTITTANGGSTAYSNATGVGYVYSGTRALTAKGTSYYFHSKNVKLLVINNGTAYAFLPMLSQTQGTVACVGYINGDTAAGFIHVGTSMYTSYGSDCSSVSYAMCVKSGISQKLLVPFAAPGGDFLESGIFKSDGIMISNFTVYAVGDRYFVDLCIDDTYQCLSIELS